MVINYDLKAFNSSQVPKRAPGPAGGPPKNGVNGLSSPQFPDDPHAGDGHICPLAVVDVTSTGEARIDCRRCGEQASHKFTDLSLVKPLLPDPNSICKRSKGNHCVLLAASTSSSSTSSSSCC